MMVLNESQAVTNPKRLSFLKRVVDSTVISDPSSPVNARTGYENVSVVACNYVMIFPRHNILKILEASSIRRTYQTIRVQPSRNDMTWYD
jgi:hypothetical protein